jgi:adenylate kinase family enzyme
MPSKRIAVIGISGAGKSVFARELAARTQLPLFHMDQLFWRGNWEAVPESEYIEQHRQLIAKDAWIIEGYVDEAMADRLSLADLVIYLDYPGTLCAWRVVHRWIMHRGTSRPELPEAARERLDPSFVWMVFRRGERPGIDAALVRGGTAQVIRLHSPREAAAYVARHHSG